MTSTLNNNIKNIRELKNYTQEYMAQGLGITQAAYSKIEKGKTDVSYAKLKKIADILQVSLQVIMSFDTQKCFNSFQHTKEDYSQSLVYSSAAYKTEKKLYQDKIALLEILLNKIDSELERYKKVYGIL
jgi:transcriptional regulator with XRE-family HTH domain